MHSLWKELLKKVNIVEIEVDPLLEQSVFTEVFTTLVSEHFSAFAVQDTDFTEQELTSDELNAMRYACGYVPHKLLKKYEKRSGEKCLKCLGNMAVIGEGDESDDLLLYTRKWLIEVAYSLSTIPPSHFLLK